MSLKEHLNKKNLHHAYLIEGVREEMVPEILSLLPELGVEVMGNSDFAHVTLDTFKVEDARNLKSYALERANSGGKKVFIVATNNFLLEAQNTLLKMFEEPIENTHFFLIVPDASALLKTFISRFYFISARQDLAVELKEAEKFIAMNPSARINFIKELLAENEDDDEALALDSSRAKALRFLNELESALHKNPVSRMPLDTYQQIFQVRKFLRMPGSSTKSLMESVALVIPVI
ncbi:MAG TPA: hypothetical protein VJC14_02295 [Candidatus Paceibacterota bacterium]